MAKYRGSRKSYSVPNKPLSLFKITAGDGSGGGLEPPCPRNAAGERVSEAGLGQGPLEGGPRDADGFLMKVEDDDLKLVIDRDMTQGEREFAYAFMAQDKPAPPGSPNACLSKYERAIIATWNDITTAEMNGKIHINELLKREANKPRPERLPQDPLVITGVNAGDVMGAPKAETKPAKPVAFADLQRGATLDAGGSAKSATPTLDTNSSSVGSEREFSKRALIRRGMNWELEEHYVKVPSLLDKIRVQVSEGTESKVVITADIKIGKTPDVTSTLAILAVNEMNKWWNVVRVDGEVTYQMKLNARYVSVGRGGISAPGAEVDLILELCREDCSDANGSGRLGQQHKNVIELPEHAVVRKSGRFGELVSPTTPPHELGHAFGLNHRFHDVGSIMSYDRPRKVNVRDLKVLADLYLD